MTSDKSKILITSIVLFLYGSCGATEDSRESETPEKIEGKSVHGNSTDSLIEYPSTNRSCSDCWVRCTDDQVSQCNFTHAYNIGSKSNCASAGREWCANRRFTYTWTGCSREGTEYPDCRCEPRGYCHRR